MIRIAIADDQAMIRQALASLLDLEQDFEVVLQASDGRNLLETLPEDVDVVLMDVEMPRLDGLTTCAALRRRFPQTRVLVVTTFGRPGYVRRALESGASGFIVKDAPLPELVEAIRKVARGEQVIDPTLAVETLTRGESPLTPRETEALQALRGGRATSFAAESLGLSRGTVRNYVSSAMDKTGAKTAAEAVIVAEKNGWLDPLG
ncbi:MAG: response regulator transcription factor [Scrofimicrobium sp.]